MMFDRDMLNMFPHSPPFYLRYKYGAYAVDIGDSGTGSWITANSKSLHGCKLLRRAELVLVKSLGPLICKPAICRRVIAIVINAVNRQRQVGWIIPVSQCPSAKGTEVIPYRVNSNATAAIAMVVSIFGIVTALPHVNPAQVQPILFSGWAETVLNAFWHGQAS